MITFARTTTIIEMMRRRQSGVAGNTIWCGHDQAEIITHRSSVSIYLICRWYREILGRKPVLFLPDFFCYDVTTYFKDIVDVVCYSVDEELRPDLESIFALSNRVDPDILLCVHYFGEIFDLNPVSQFCKNHRTILIEDAAHVISPKGRVAKYGDFVIYSPWKTCGLPDGAILLIAKNEILGMKAREIDEKLLSIESELPEYPCRYVFYWKCKQLLKLLIPNIFHNIHRKPSVQEDSCLIYKVSRYSRQILASIDRVSIDRLGEKKQINAEILMAWIGERYKVKPAGGKSDGYPYALAVKFDSKHEKELAIRDLERIGDISSIWPNLSDHLNETSIALQMRDAILLIAIHDGIKPSKISRLTKTESNSVNLQNSIGVDRLQRNEYERITDGCSSFVPLLQSPIYGDAKEHTDGWKTEYWKIYNSKHDVVAVVMSLKKYGCVYRINRGPVVLDDKYEDDILLAVSEKFTNGLKCFFWAPNCNRTGKRILLFCDKGLKYLYKNSLTGIIDLRLSIEELRGNLDSKWRNQLKRAESGAITVEQINETQQFEQLIRLHDEDKVSRGYSDSGDRITRYLFQKGQLLVFRAKSGLGEILSFVMVAKHGKSATYLVGWNNKAAKERNAGRLLMWHTIVALKEYGFLWLDLGGINRIDTPSVADFKLGMNAREYDYIGEFVGF